nr:glycosyltransferase family 4 protein [Methanobacterium alcaliphilum]
MIKILIICHQIPFKKTTNAFSYRVLNALKYLKEDCGHELSLVSFKYPDDPEDYAKKYCNDVFTFTLPESNKERKKQYLKEYIKGILKCRINFKNIYDYRFSWQMYDKIKDLVSKNHFDLIFVNEPSMISYALNFDNKKIAESCSLSKAMQEAYQNEKKIFKKIYYLIDYKRMKNLEKYYANYNLCLTVTEEEKELLLKDNPNLTLEIIPYGISLDFNFNNLKENFPTLAFLGSLNSTHNQKSVLYLYKKIYPIIKNKFPDIKLFIIGKEPPRSILNISKNDPSVVVTGYVHDVKDYLVHSSIIILPIHGYGIKTRVLESMALGIPIICSPEAVHGIDVENGKNIILASDTKEFINNIIKLLNDEKLRRTIGSNGKKLMEKKYSWLKMNKNLNYIFEGVASENENS